MLADESTATLDSQNEMAVMDLRAHVAPDKKRALLAAPAIAARGILQTQYAHQKPPYPAFGTPEARRQNIRGSRRGDGTGIFAPSLDWT